MSQKIFKGQGYEIAFEVNNWAERSNVSVVVRSKDTLILTTAVIKEEHPELDFIPLTVEYEERYYAIGKIFGSRFIRRETRPSDIAVLNARLIDRAIRAALPSNLRRAIQIVNLVLSYDFQTEPAVLALLGSSVAINMLGVNWFGPVGAVKISLLNDGIKFFPSSEEEEKSLFNIVLSNVNSKINMIEFEGKEISKDDIMKVLKVGLTECQKISNFIKENFVPNSKIEAVSPDLIEAEKILDKFLSDNKLDLKKALFAKEEGEKNYNEVFEMIFQKIETDKVLYVIQAARNRLKKIFQETVLKEQIRPDGRKIDEIRPLSGQVGILPKAHGSAIFFRGLTHILSSVTLAPPGEELWVRTVEYEGYKRFMHHYNFPPFATAEIKPLKGIGRREIGHGYLAEKSLAPLIPSENDFPYIIRIVSDVLSSNGSTSMGSVTASSMALMDAGVPISRHAAGISIGIAYENDEYYALLTDIQGPEDFFGGMDFKIAGTEKGLTAIQLDVKIEGLTLKMIEEAFNQAEKALQKIFTFQKSIISKPRANISSDVPRVKMIRIDPDKIGLLIGSGGRTIQEITSVTQTKIDIKPDGLIYIIGDDFKNIQKADIWARIITNNIKIGEKLTAKIIKQTPSGFIMELAPNKTAFLHISEKEKKIKDKELTPGEEIEVKIKEITEDGKIYLSL